MVGFNKGRKVRKKPGMGFRKKPAEPEVDDRQANDIEDMPQEDAEPKSRFRPGKKKRPKKRKRGQEEEQEPVTEEKQNPLEESLTEMETPDVSQCYSYLSGLDIQDMEVESSTFLTWLVKRLKMEALPPVIFIVDSCTYTKAIEDDIREAYEAVEGIVPDDIIDESATMKVNPQQPKKKSVEVNIL